ncbi:MAG TPA: lamin tail domain-containing protein [Verrucomicrobiales bacterium]|nr:lamin tail domain-containing protein [Verrucomicrobiales bacterium]
MIPPARFYAACLLVLTALFLTVPESRAFTSLGAGTGALLGSDLTDPENNGSDASGTGFNWVSIQASSENAWSAEGAYNVFDNKVGAGDDKWCCDPAPQWIAVKLDKPYVLTHFTIAAGNDAPERDPTRWAIEGSNDGTNWTPIYAWTAGYSVFSQRLEVLRFNGAGADFPSPPPYLWFRYSATSQDGPLHQINELEFFGVPTIVIKNFSVDKPLIPTAEPITLSWELDPGTTSVSISGIGDVTGQTVNGLGSRVINPGPSATTIYTMTAVHPTTTGQQAVTVTVTNQPIIRSFTATPPIIGPGASSTLNWNVINYTGLQLDGVNVTGTSLVVTPPVTKTYTLSATNPNGTVAGTATVSVVIPGVPVINEFMADNDGALLVDGDGEKSDWIEIHNPSGTPAALQGYFLTDDPTDLQKWSFPAVSLASNAYMIVFASGKDRRVAGSPLHTNFSLDAGGEYLALVKPDGVTIVSEFGSAVANFPEQEEGVSFGMHSNPPQPGYFSTSTPGAANSTGFSGFVADTKFSLNRGFYNTPQTLTITTSTQGASIRYTTNGAWPSETAGTLYTGPITVDRTMPVRAIAYKTGHRSTNVDTNTYIFVNDVVTQTPANTQATWGLPATWGSQAPDYGMNQSVVTLHNATIRNDLKTVPTLSVVTDAAMLFGPSGNYSNPNSSGEAWERAISLELIDPAIPDGSNDFQLNCGIRIQGGAFRSFGLTPKKSFRVLFKQDYGPSKLRYPLFGSTAVKEFDTLILRMESNDGYQWDNRTDVQYARDEFGRRTAAALGMPTGHGRFLHLYINGVYWGIFNVVERPDSAFGEAYFGAEKDLWDGINFGTATNEGSTVPWNTMVSLLSAIPSAPTEAAKTAAYMKAQGLNPDGTRNPAWADYINVDNFIDYLLANWYTGNADWPHRNYYTGRERDILDPAPLKGVRTSTGMHFFMWDVETSMLLGSSNDKTGDTNGVCVPYGSLRNSLEFRVKFGDHAHRALFNGGPLTPQPCLDRYAEITKDHRSIIIPELARWGDQHGTQRTLAQWESTYNSVRNSWLATRTTGLLNVLKGANLYPQTAAPTFSKHGGSVLPATPVTMATNSDKIYYTMDGSDPRLLGGAPNPAAQLASFGGGGPLPVTYMNTGHVWKYLDNGSNQGTAWYATNFNDTTWSSGPSSLGYGTEGEGAGTTVGFGGNTSARYATTYFRTTVNIPNPSQFVNFLLRIKYDDGAAVYINGTERVRTANLPAGSLYNFYTGTGVADEQAWYDYTLPTSNFVAGVNTIAVEIHQASAGSTDIRLDMFLRGETSSGGSNVSDPLFFSQPTLLSARSFSTGTGEWSALNQAFFSIDSVPASAANLVISEFSYRPLEPTSPAEIAVSANRDEYEFIELMNISAQAIDLTGVGFTAGITFNFPDNTLVAAGGKIVVAKNLSAFNARYPGSTNVVGPYALGNLANDGEHLLLTSSKTGVIRDFTYDDEAPWPAGADGQGFSLVLIAPATNPDHGVAAHWRTSAAANGTPGTTDTTGYSAWKQARGIASDSADPDLDGLSNFAEYAMGTAFDAPSNGQFPVAQLVSEGGSDYRAIAVRRSLGAADDVDLIVETSADLKTWTADAVYAGESNNGDGQTATVTWREPQPANVSGRRYMRARFVLR